MSTSSGEFCVKMVLKAFNEFHHKIPMWHSCSHIFWQIFVNVVYTGFGKVGRRSPGVSFTELGPAGIRTGWVRSFSSTIASPAATRIGRTKKSRIPFQWTRHSHTVARLLMGVRFTPPIVRFIYSKITTAPSPMIISLFSHTYFCVVDWWWKCILCFC